MSSEIICKTNSTTRLLDIENEREKTRNKPKKKTKLPKLKLPPEKKPNGQKSHKYTHT